MSAAKRKSQSRKSKSAERGARRLTTQRADVAGDGSPSTLIAWWAVAMFVARLLVPTEGAALGDSLWLTQCWLFLACFWVIDAFRRDRLRFRCDRLDVAVGVLVAGHVVSAVVVLLNEGDKRAALNMLWEWVGLGVSFVLIRQVVQSRVDVGRFLWSATSLVVVLAAFGLYQHYVMLPNMAAEYRDTRQKLDRPITGESPALSQSEIRELRNKLPKESMNADGTERQSYRNRLLSSTAPFGQFALANTFAGLLGVGLIPLLAVLGGAIRNRGWTMIVGAAIAVAVIAYCLLLTKSRTAWIAVAGGVAVWWWVGGKKRSGGRSAVFGWCLVAFGVVGAFVAIAAATGGIDGKTFSESPKSLRYRLQYWTGTVSVLRDRPIFGPGPGNFRQDYLKYKAPESSEEIRDPHNLILDAWASGGLIALLGLAGVVIIGMSSLRTRRDDVADGHSTTSDDHESEIEGASYSPATWVAGAVCGFLLVIGAKYTFDLSWDWQLPALLAGCLIAHGVLAKPFAATTISPACIAGAWAMLLIHLLGAGGMEYPAIVQLLLIAPVLILRTQPRLQTVSAPTVGEHPSLGQSTVWIWLAATGTVAGLCFISSTVPVQARRWKISAGEYELRETGRMGAAKKYFAEAAAADRLSPEPPEWLARLAFLTWQRGGQDEKSFEAAVNWQKTTIRLDPNRSTRYRVLGQWYAEKFRHSGNPDDAKQGIAWYRECLSRYPHHSVVVAKMAILMSQVEGYADDATSNARRAIELDDINRNEEHSDRLLPKSLRGRLEEIVGRPRSST